jgi:hypothetical protein
VLLAAALVAFGLSLFKASQLKLEQSIESLYALDDPHLVDYRQSKALFGGDEFVGVVYADSNLLTPEGLSKVRTFADELSQIPGVQAESTQNLAETLLPSQVPWLLRPLFERRRPELIELSRGLLIGADNETTGIILRLAPEDKTTVPRDETINRIRRQAESHDPPAYVVGEPVQVHDMFQYVEEDGELLFYASLVLLGLVIFVLFRSVRWVVLAIVLVAITVTWTKALLVVCGMRLSMVSSMLNSLVTIVGIATVTRVLVYYREQRASSEKLAAFRKTFVEISPAILWTTATAAAGFVSLLSSDITPVRSFGTMMTIGTLLVLVSGAAILPAGILYERTGRDLPDAPLERQLIRFLGGMTVWVERRSHYVIAGTVLLFAFAIAGLFRLTLDTDFSRNFRASSPIVRALDFVETRLGGAGTWEVNFPAPHELTPDYLNRVRALAAKLRAQGEGEAGGPRLTKVVAITDLVDLLPGSMADADDVRRKLRMIAIFKPEFEPGLYNGSQGRMRLVLRGRERQSSETKLKLIDDVGAAARTEFGEAKTTGIFVLLAYLIESLLRDQTVSFAIAIVLVLIIMVFAYRSARIGLVSLIPNIFPILLVIGTMGWLDIPLNVGTAMIAAVSMGLTVDASIFYLYGYRRMRDTGLSLDDSLRETHQGFGRALVFGTLALVVGFSVLALSRFIPMVYFGVLVSLAMIGGLIGNLLLLPILLRWVDRDPTNRSDALPSHEPAGLSLRSLNGENVEGRPNLHGRPT